MNKHIKKILIDIKLINPRKNKECVQHNFIVSTKGKTTENFCVDCGYVETITKQ